MRGAALATAAVVVLAAACTGGEADATVAAGWTLEEVRDDLSGPTQLALGPDGTTLYVAELNGEEGAGTGRVLDLGDLGAADEPLVVVDDLLKPTGLLALSGGSFLVQEEQEVVRYDLAGPVRPGERAPEHTRTVLVDGLPFNGRSQGTLTLLDDGRVLHTSTGSGTRPDGARGSGILYATRVVPGARPEPTPVAVGFKNAYAHTPDGDGGLWVTDIGDGRYDGDQVVEELNHVEDVDGRPPYDGGWPLCVGEARPVEEFGATTEDCADTEVPFATFPPRSTPTSVAVTADGRLLVALFTTAFVDGGVVEVLPDGTTTEVLTDVQHPQDLLALPDGSVLLTVHGTGRLLRLVPTG